MTIEKRQTKLQKNNEARERWMRKLFRAATELKKIEQERKRLLYPKGKPGKVRAQSLDEIRERAAASGYDFNDDIPS